jgi:hypothetical protein
MTHYRDIFDSLTHHCRVMTAEQIANYWFAHTASPVKIAHQFLRRQQRQQLLKLEHAMIHPPLELVEPIIDWKPGFSDEPHWESIAWQVQSRWNRNPVRAIIVSATHEARYLCGGAIGGRSIRQTEISHDITLAQLWLRLRQTAPEIAAQWIPEDAISAERLGKRRPDAFLGNDDSQIAIELGGKAYSAKRLSAIHAAHRHRHYHLY